MTASPSSTDVFIAGGGPAGLAAAIAAAQRGFSVMLADPGRPPIDKACGEGIMPEGVAALRALGVAMGDFDCFPLDGIRFVDAAAEVSAHFPLGTGLGVRRTGLHAALAAKAQETGVRLAWGTRVESVRQGEAIAGGQSIRSRYILCADGQNSTLRAMTGLGAKPRHTRYGFRCHYRLPPWSHFVEVYWAQCGQLYITPVSTEEVCIALLTDDPHLRLESALSMFPAFCRQMPASFSGALRARTMGGITTTRRLQSVISGRIALLGDCSGSADAITGDGLSMAFQQALALAEAISRDSLHDYQQQHDRISRVPRAMGELLRMLGTQHRLRGRVFRVFADSPELFARLLAVHTSTVPPSEVEFRDYLRLGWKLLFV